jgi:hypothetical protein
MNELDIKQLLERIDSCGNYESFCELGVLLNSYDDKIYIYSSKLFSSIRMIKQNDQIKSMTFFFKDEIKLLEASTLLGSYDIKYNYRDNISRFIFKKTISNYKNIDLLYIDKDNNYEKKDDTLFEYSDQGILVAEFDEKDFYIDNITINL